MYEVKNNINGKIYVGVHKTKRLDDGYMGSGKIIISAIRKYGIENFSKTILEKFNSEEEMLYKESQIVTDEFLDREDVYNLRRGGTGGFDYITKIGKNKNHTLTTDERRRGAASTNAKKTINKTHSDGKLKHTYFTKESSILASEMARQINKGSIEVSFIGLNITKRIKKDLLPNFIEQGWVKGRIKN